MEATYTEALERQIEIWRLWCSHEGNRLASVFQETRLPHDGCGMTSRNFRLSQIHTLEQADAYYVSLPVCELLEGSLDSLPDIPLINLQIPSVAGWVYFASPRRILESPGIHAGYSHMSGFTWHQTQMVKLGQENEVAVFHPDIRRATPLRDFEPDYLAITFYGTAADYPKILPVTYLDWPLHEGWKKHFSLVEITLKEEFVKQGDKYSISENNLRYMCQYVAAFFAFIMQTISAQVPNRVPRAISRRLRRTAILSQPLVRIVQLRRVEYQHRDVLGQRSWACRWIVRSHWRSQYYPSVGLHKPKLIPAYIKGPEDKPLKKPSINLFAIVR